MIDEVVVLIAFLIEAFKNPERIRRT